MLAKHREAALVTEFRPIASARLFCKTFAYMILHRIQPCLDSHQPEEQHGFRAGRRLEEQLLTANLFLVYGGTTSHQHPQCFGISQGCPLSPFLFSIVMTMLIQDAKATFLSRRDPARTGEISELMHADGTLILATNNEDAEIYMQCIEQAGRMYGLQLNWNKLEVLPVRCEARVRTPNGELVVSKESLVYLGSYLCDNGSIGPELNRRLGAARAEFETLSRVWNHAVLPKSKKIRIFEACVLSKLLYCLHTAWLNEAELRRLNVFQSKCFRKILNIPHSYVSRISNKTVLERSGRQEISNILTYR